MIKRRRAVPQTVWQQKVARSPPYPPMLADTPRALGELSHHLGVLKCSTSALVSPRMAIHKSSGHMGPKPHTKILVMHSWNFTLIQRRGPRSRQLPRLTPSWSASNSSIIACGGMARHGLPWGHRPQDCWSRASCPLVVDNGSPSSFAMRRIRSDMRLEPFVEGTPASSSSSRRRADA